MKLHQGQQNQLKKMGVVAAYLTLKAYDKLYRLFSDALADTSGEPNIVFLQFTPLALQYRAIRDGKLLYESDRKARFRYQEHVLKFHADIKHFIDIRHQAILNRI